MLSVFSKMFNVDKVVSKSVNDNINLLLKSGAEFVPTEIIKDDKTAGWNENDYVEFSRLISLSHKDMDFFLEHKFKGNENMKNYNSKACKNYLTLCNQPTPDKLKDTRKEVFSHREQMKVKKKELKNFKVQPCIIAGHKLVSNIITASHHDAENLKTHIKKHSNEISALDKLFNAMTNKKNETPR